MCSQCDELQANSIATWAGPDAYVAFTSRLADMVKAGRLRVLQQDCPLDETVRNLHTPADGLSHELACTGCGDRFSLYVNTYKGAIGWRRLAALDR